MKKTLTWMCIFTALLLLTACGKQTAAEPTPDPEETAQAQTIAQTADNPYGIDTEKFDQETFLSCCEEAFDTVWTDPKVHGSNDNHLERELMVARSIVKAETGISWTKQDISAYTAWRETNHPNPKPDFPFEETDISVQVTSDQRLLQVPCHYHGQVIADLEAGTVFDQVRIVYGMDGTALWVEVTHDGKTGYLDAEQLVDSETGDAITKPATQPSNNKPSSSQVNSGDSNSNEQYSEAPTGGSGGFKDFEPNLGDGTPPEYSSDTSGIDTSDLHIHG